MASESKFIITSKHTFNPENYLVTVDAGSDLIIEIKDKEKYDKNILDNVEWIAQMIWKKPTFKREHLHEGLKGSKIYFNFPEPYDGGGLAWIEPVFPGEEPTNTAPNGYFINSKGLPRGIAKIEWREYQEDGLGKLIDSSEKKFGEAVQLHVYTRGLYGHNIKVKLRDYNNYDYDLNFEEAEKPEVFFKEITSEVRLFKDVTNTSAKVQKAIINIQIEPRWDYAGNYLKIGTLVTSELSKPFDSVSGDHEVYLRVRQPEPNEEIKPSPLAKSGNKPTVIENIPTDPAEYHPCRYEKITVDCKKERWDAPFDIYSKTDTSVNGEIHIPIVVGVDKNRKSLKFIIEKLKTDDCIYNKTKESHEFVAINDINIRNTIKSYNGNSEKLTNPESKSTLTLTNGISKISVGDAWSIVQKSRPPIIITSDYENFELELVYDYSRGGTSYLLTGFAETLIPTLTSNIQKYFLSFNSCAIKRNIVIEVYPDTKSTLQLGFNYSKSKFNDLTNIYHKTWELKKIEAEEERAKLKPVIESAKYYNVPDEANRKDKEQEDIINVADNNLSLVAKTKNKAKELSAKNALKNELISCDFAMMAEFDLEGKIDLSSEAEEVVDFIKTLVKLKDKIEGIFNGKDSDTNKKAPKDEGKLSDRLKSLDDILSKKKKSKKAKKKYSFNFIPPSIALSVSLSAKQPEDVIIPTVGTEIKAVLDFNPLFGFEITYDIYALLYKIKHPAVLAVVATLDVLDDVLGDNFDIDIDLVITSKIDIKLQGIINTASEDNMIQKTGTDAKVGGSIAGVLTAKTQVNGSTNILGFGQYDAYAELSGTGQIGIGIDFIIKADKTGIYLEPIFKFDGLIFKGTAKFGVSKAETEKADTKKKASLDKYKKAKQIINGTSEEDWKGADRELETRGVKIAETKAQSGIHYKVEGEMIVLEKGQWPKEGEPSPYRWYMKKFNTN
ncbi:hypothetical protein Celal_3718 [Cellulophaga algicola DSM 14237]|uniref:Uncharacterized protein n=1 Tax=Cellulophaga algicola (strain DSM 14237 / IC166 / ACAM 630) TaxID=688270 RepID=E6XA12_CELAD|nr:hypothetical protein [Cellulophaga algicola]ADV50973.1 hypothetical protein Celal_3718 [Cellulophaga algicola DSM 14237]